MKENRPFFIYKESGEPESTFSNQNPRKRLDEIVASGSTAVVVAAIVGIGIAVR